MNPSDLATWASTQPLGVNVPQKWENADFSTLAGGFNPATNTLSPQLSQVPIPRISASHSEGEIAALGSKENPAKTNPELATQTQTTHSLKCCPNIPLKSSEHKLTSRQLIPR